MSYSRHDHDDSLYGALVESAVDGIITIDEQGMVRSFNGAAETLFGYRREEVLGHSVNRLMPREYAAHHDQYIANYLNGFKAKIIGIGRDVTGQRKYGSTFPMHLSVGEARTEKGRMFVGVCHDQTEQKALLLRLARAEKRFKDIVQSQKEMICRLDENLRLTFANRSCIEGLGWSERELIGSQFPDFVNEDQRALAKRSIRELLDTASDAHERNVMLHMRGAGVGSSVDWTFIVLSAPDGEGVEIQGNGLDVTEHEAAIERAQYLINHDQLTSLLNRQSVLDQFSARSAANTTFAVLYFDCNHFGLINQKFGHEVGDQLLIIAAQRLRENLPDEALIARPSGDDFIVVCPLSVIEETSALAATLLTAQQAPYELNGNTVEVRGRVGIAHYPHGGADLDKVIRVAESAIIYKDRVIDGLSFYSPTHQRTMTRTLDIEQRLRVAIDLGHLDVYLQPKYTLADRQLVGYEALIRWHDETGFIAPSEFVPIAERMGMGVELDRYVIANVCQALATADRAGFDSAPVAINITAAHFGESGFSEFLFDSLSTGSLSADRIELEITEGVLVDLEGLALDNLRALTDQGIRVHIDDFGTGYSSLSYLSDLPVDVLKIDRVFIDRLSDAQGMHLVEGIIAMARALQLDVIAEGIETQAQVEQLTAMGCRAGQGFLLGRPAPIAEVLQNPG